MPDNNEQQPGMINVSPDELIEIGRRRAQQEGSGQQSGLKGLFNMTIDPEKFAQVSQPGVISQVVRETGKAAIEAGANGIVRGVAMLAGGVVGRRIEIIQEKQAIKSEAQQRVLNAEHSGLVDEQIGKLGKKREKAENKRVQREIRRAVLANFVINLVRRPDIIDVKAKKPGSK